MIRHAIRREERLPKLVGWGAAVAICLGVALLYWLAPYRLIQTVPLAEPSGSAFLEGWLGLPIHLIVVLLAVGGAVATLRWQRGAERCFEPLAVLAAAFGVVGMSAASAALRRAADFPHHPPIPLLRFGEALMALAVVSGLLALPRLFAHRARRGWGLAIGATGICAGSLFFVERLYLNPPSEEPADGVELVRVEHAVDWWGGGEPFPRVAAVRADGSVELEGAALPAGAHEAWDARLRELASGMARGMARDGAFVDEPLWIRTDARAPMSALTALVRLAGEARIWKLQLGVARVERGFPQAARSFWPLYLELDGPGAVAPLRTVRVARDASDALRYGLGGETAPDLPTLHARLGGVAEGPLGVRVEGELTWAEVAAALDVPELERLELTLGSLR